MGLSKDQVRKVGKLANLSLSDNQVDLYATQLSRILDYIDQLNEVDVSLVKPTYNVSNKTNVTEEDHLSTSFTQEEALSNASSKKNGYFVTKGVFENE